MQGMFTRKKLVIAGGMVVATAAVFGFVTKALSAEAAILSICVMYFSVRIMG